MPLTPKEDRLRMVSGDLTGRKQGRWLPGLGCRVSGDEGQPKTKRNHARLCLELTGGSGDSEGCQAAGLYRREWCVGSRN